MSKLSKLFQSDHMNHATGELTPDNSVFGRLWLGFINIVLVTGFTTFAALMIEEVAR